MQMHISAEELTQHGEVKFCEMEKALELKKQDNAKLSSQLVAYEAEMSTLQSKLQKNIQMRSKESATLKEQLSLYEAEITQLEARCKAAEQKQKETLADCERSRLCAKSISPELQARASSDEELRRLEALIETQTKEYAEKEVALAHALDKSCSSNASKAAGHHTRVSYEVFSY
jgi:seryl-tRNA synthetase